MSEPATDASPDQLPGVGNTTPSARVVADAMYRGDLASQSLGITLVAVEAGRATVTMTVRPDMINGLGVCHGGLIFTLADSAMAFASNAANERSLAVHADIDWLNPARPGAVLTAQAEERTRRGRTAVNDAVVTDETGTVIATFRGRTLTVGGSVLPPDGD